MSSNSTDAAAAAAAAGDSAALATAQRRLAGEFALGDLPQTRDDEIWGRIETRYGLSLNEMSALKNYACPSQPRGVLPRIAAGGLYRIHDERIRAEFTITNRISPSRCYTMPAELLVDSGAQSELKLPARKVVQLGLEPFGPPTNIRGTTNHVSMVLNFPPVLVKATFDRNGVRETVQNYLAVRCDKNDYDALIAANAVQQVANTGNQPREPDSATPEQQRSNAAGTTLSDSGPITEIRLSPARHRPRSRPDEQAVMGIDGLKKLRLHLNCERQQLEIEEEEVLDPDEW
jgi:hypothetical protein